MTGHPRLYPVLIFLLLRKQIRANQEPPWPLLLFSWIMKMRNGLGKTAFYIISSEKCICLNIPGTKEHAERKQASQSWVGPDLLLHDPEIANNLKSPMLNDPEVWLLGENPKRLYGDTIANVRTLLFVTLENWKWPKCTSTREWMKKLGLSNNKSDKSAVLNETELH